MSYYSILIGATELALTAANDIYGVRVSGGGMPPVENVTSRYALMDGALWQRAVVRERVITISMLVSESTLKAFLAARRSLIDAVNGHVAEAITLKYFYGDGAHYIYLNCVYDGGLDGSEQATTYERIGLRLLAVDPYWYDDADTTGNLTVRTATADVHNIVWLKADGTISNMDTGLDDAPTMESVIAITRTPGKIQAFGSFTTAGDPDVAVKGAAEWTEAAATWANLAVPWTSVTNYLSGGDIILVAQGPGMLYLYGFCLTTGPVQTHVFFTYDGASWTWAASNVIKAFATGPDGILWAASSGVGGLCVEYWNGSTWTRVTSWANDGSYNGLVVTQDNTVYLGGAFTSVDGVTAANIAKYNPATDVWSALGAGAAFQVSRLAVAPNGVVYAAIQEETMAQVFVTLVHAWNGVTFTPLGGQTGFLGIVQDLVWTGNGLLALYDSPGVPTVSGVAYWRGNQWHDVGIGYGSATVLMSVSTGDSGVYLGGFFPIGDWISPGITSLTNEGNAKAYPVIVLSGPGALYSLHNYTTGQRIEFDLTILEDEVVTIDLRPGIKTITSSYRGNILYAVTSGSLVDWHLAPGPNSISLWLNNAAAAASYGFTPRYLSNDMVWTEL